MAKDEHPSVYVVDSHATYPPIPPRLHQRRRSSGAAQTLLFLLVSVALCGMAIEACFIYHLYRPKSVASPLSSKLTGGQDGTSPTKLPNYNILPSKPVAHLTDGQDVVHGEQIMAWSMLGIPLLYEMDYKDGGLIIQKEGYYYVYSKVFFFENNVFFHAVNMNTQRYSGKSITLLQSRKISPRHNNALANSYLGGVFHFYKDDVLFVKVSNTTKIMRHKPYENIFDGQDVVHGEQIMAWSMLGIPLLYEMDYKDGGLIIQKEGYYYVYSKVFFFENNVFFHAVNMNTQRYSGKSITLLQSRKISPRHNNALANSYLGGVFHFYKDDVLFVKVSNTTKIMRHKPYENIFGAFMI